MQTDCIVYISFIIIWAQKNICRKTESDTQLKLKTMYKRKTVTKTFVTTETKLKIKNCKKGLNWNPKKVCSLNHTNESAISV